MAVAAQKAANRSECHQMRAVDHLPPGVSHLDGRGPTGHGGNPVTGPTLWVWRDGDPPLLVTAFLTAVLDGPVDATTSGVVVALLRRT